MLLLLLRAPPILGHVINPDHGAHSLDKDGDHPDPPEPGEALDVVLVQPRPREPDGLRQMLGRHGGEQERLYRPTEAREARVVVEQRIV